MIPNEFSSPPISFFLPVEPFYSFLRALFAIPREEEFACRV